MQLLDNMRQRQGGTQLVREQNRKLNVLLVIVAVVAAAYLWRTGWHGAAYIVVFLAANELLEGWGGLYGLLLAPLLAVQWLYMRLTKRQQRSRTVYAISGREFYAQPITRSVQERLVAMVPDSALEDQQQVPAMLAGLVQGAEQPDAADMRRMWLASLDSTYEQLALLLVDRANPDPDDPAAHPSVEWLGDVCPVARAGNLLQEIQARAQVEDNLPS